MFLKTIIISVLLLALVVSFGLVTDSRAAFKLEQAPIKQVQIPDELDGLLGSNEIISEAQFKEEIKNSRQAYFSGRTFYVDGNRPYSGNGQSPEKALKTIEEAVEVASQGDVIVVMGACVYQLDDLIRPRPDVHFYFYDTAYVISPQDRPAFLFDYHESASKKYTFFWGGKFLGNRGNESGIIIDRSHKFILSNIYFVGQIPGTNLQPLEFGLKTNFANQIYITNSAFAYANEGVRVGMGYQDKLEFTNNVFDHNKRGITLSGMMASQVDVVNNAFKDNDYGIYSIVEQYSMRPRIKISYNGYHGVADNFSHHEPGHYFAEVYESAGNKFQDPYFKNGSWYKLRADSLYRDAGDPGIRDRNGTRSDIGIHGGPYNFCKWPLQQL
ncbi:right-handed parallel beta-helix repeat-containing protein [Patescibacteria group bacterium]